LKLGDIYKILDTISPFELQESWDNSGLQIGSFDDNIKSIVVSMDVDFDLLNSLKEKSLLITHHPLLFKSIKEINFAKYPSNLIKKFIKKDIYLISMHTNFDKTHLNRYVAKEILGFDTNDCQDYICYFDIDKDFDEILLMVKKAFGLKSVRAVKCHDKIERIALTTGAGGSFIKELKANLFLTGDIKYHDAMEAKSLGISLIDIEHYCSERFFGDILADELKKYQIEAIIASTKNPFINY